MENTNAVYIVTGAGKGIGFATTRQLLASGHHVVALSRNTGPLEDLSKEGLTGHLDIRAMDITEDAKMVAFQNWLENYAIKVKGLVNNAGALVNKPFMELTKADFNLCYDVNVFAPARLIQVCLPHFTPDAHIINISSIGGFQGSLKFAGLSAYSSSKAAIVGLTECLHEEFKETGLAFNCLCLGSVQTEMLADAFPGYQASMSAETMGTFVSDFLQRGHFTMRGKVLPVSITNP
jgi:3-oxoacyl-[acyl-carrier protein] reductase